MVRDAVGLEVLRVAKDGAASRMNVLSGDRLLLVNDEPIAEPKQLGPRIRALGPFAPLVLTVQRDGQTLRLEGETLPLPLETLDGAEVCPGEIVVEGARLRTWLTIPHGFAPPYCTFFVLPGLGCGSCELSMDPADPTRRLLEGLSALGFATLRVERSGVGDSEGRPCQTLGFFDEAASYREAIEVFSKDPRISSLLLLGQSVGGMMAPLFASAGAAVSGVIVFGTSSLRWVDCIVSATLRQRRLAGMEGEELASLVFAWSEMHRLVCREGKTPREVFATRPDLAFLQGTACHGEWMYGRHVSFFQELERLDLPALWRTVVSPVLVLHGEYDWVCEPAEGKGIHETIVHASPEANRSTYVELAGIGHDMRRHESLAKSYQDPRLGVWDGSVLDAIKDWIGHTEIAKLVRLDDETRPVEG